MDSAAPRLPTALGSFAALLVAGVGFVVQVSPATCLMRAFAAFVVFAAFGIVIRFLLGDETGKQSSSEGSLAEGSEEEDVEAIAPGTKIEELLED